MIVVIRISEVEIISMFTSASASARNMRAAYPGAFWMPAPTIEIFATDVSVVSSRKPSSPAIAWS